MKPAARLHIIKQREYRPACPKSVEPAVTGDTPGISWNPPEPDSFIYNGVGVGGTYILSTYSVVLIIQHL